MRFANHDLADEVAKRQAAGRSPGEKAAFDVGLKIERDRHGVSPSE
jgi:hypothetical protein